MQLSFKYNGDGMMGSNYHVIVDGVDIGYFYPDTWETDLCDQLTNNTHELIPILPPSD